MNKKIQEYIKKMRSESKNDEQIKQSMREVGWTEDNINDINFGDGIDVRHIENNPLESNPLYKHFSFWVTLFLMFFIAIILDLVIGAIQIIFFVLFYVIFSLNRKGSLKELIRDILSIIFFLVGLSIWSGAFDSLFSYSNDLTIQYIFFFLMIPLPAFLIFIRSKLNKKVVTNNKETTLKKKFIKFLFRLGIVTILVSSYFIFFVGDWAIVFALIFGVFPGILLIIISGLWYWWVYKRDNRLHKKVYKTIKHKHFPRRVLYIAMIGLIIFLITSFVSFNASEGPSCNKKSAIAYRINCNLHGGENLCGSSESRCGIKPTSDAGKPCNSSSQCEGKCLSTWIKIKQPCEGKCIPFWITSQQEDVYECSEYIIGNLDRIIYE